jgi:SAM-dependent methyltransferase
VISPTVGVSPSYLKACCAEVWSHPAARLLIGDALRPGGVEETRHALELMELGTGARVLDLGSGTGATLGALRSAGFRAVGTDYSRALATESAERAPTAVADAELLPFASASVDAVFCECVLSTIPDKPRALAEIRRVLGPGGRLALSDVVVEGSLPSPLDSVAGWIACAAGACDAPGYERLLAGAGFTVEVREDHRRAMAALVSQIRRRLALFAGALRAGLVQDRPESAERLIEVGETLLAAATAAVESGALGYGLYVAAKVQ